MCPHFTDTYVAWNDFVKRDGVCHRNPFFAFTYSVPQMNFDIGELRDLEDKLRTSRVHGLSRVGADAKVNIIKYRHVHTALQFQANYDDLYYELNMRGELECLRSIALSRSEHLFQPKALELQDGSEEDRLEKQLQFYLADAELEKLHLDELVTKVAHDSRKYKVKLAEVKTPKSTRRKATRFCHGDVRKVTDMARVTVVCTTPEAFKEAYSAIMGVHEVAGYADS